MSKILIIGESCLDVFTYGSCNRLCPEAPVPVFNKYHTSENHGMAMNVYNNILSLGVKSDLMTNTNWRQIKKNRFIDERTNHMFIRVDSNDDDYQKCDVTKIKYDKYDAVVISDYNKGFISNEDIKYISEHHPLTFLDTKKSLGSWSSDITFIKINLVEYEKSKKFVDNNIANQVIITMGADGCRHRGIMYPVPKVEIKDTSGAGDTFLASFVTKFLEQGSVEDSIDFANKCATQVVQKRGVSVIKK
jgi:D-beta-D-heptose 7-phosphate kinase/D-beta-D-heptose 1-phosphate adenosyltransferase